MTYTLFSSSDCELLLDLAACVFLFLYSISLFLNRMIEVRAYPIELVIKGLSMIMLANQFMLSSDKFYSA
jgi:hypothetical protein